MRTLVPRAAALALLPFLFACQPGLDARASLAAQSEALLPVPSDPSGNGPYALLVCLSDSGTATPRTCNGTTNITSNATLVNALTIPGAALANAPSLPPAFPFTFSWNLGTEVNFWNDDGNSANDKRARGVFFSTSSPAATDVSLRTFYGDNKNLVRVPIAISGFISIPPAVLPATSTIKTFAVGADDGAFFAIEGCTNNGTTCTSSVPFTNTIQDVTAGHQMTFNAVKVVFPGSGGLFPFQLLWYQTNTGEVNSGFELVWADGDVTGNLPVWTGGPTDAWSNPGAFELVPKSALYGPDVRATLAISPPGATIAANTATPLTYTATISNVGKAPAYPLTAGGAGLEYKLALPIGAFPAVGSVTAITVNDVALSASAVTAATSATVQNIVVTVNVPGRNSADHSLLPGSANAATVAVTATSASNLASGASVQVQGTIRGQGTDPSIVNLGCAGCVTPPQTLFVYTNDPTFRGSFDNGNAPAPLARAGGGALVANGTDDDDSTGIIVGSASAGAPTVTAFPANRVSTADETTLSGTVSGSVPNGSPAVQVRLAGVAQADCASYNGGLGGTEWAWDAVAAVCSCTTVSSGGTWTCDTILLRDCNPAGSLCYTATPFVGDNFGTGAAGSAYAFTARAPGATITAPANASTQTTHRITPAGSATAFADGTGGPPPLGTPVTVTVTGPSSFSATCTGSTDAVGSWTCSSNIQLSGDFTFTATAAVTELNLDVGPQGTPVTFTADTKPTLTAPTGGVTNSLRPTFGGTKKGDGTTVRVCPKAAGQCASGSANSCTAAVSATKNITWTCTPGADIVSGTYVAYEIDAGPSFSAPSDDFVLTINTAGATATNVPANKTFTLANTTSGSFTFTGTCTNGETVTASIANGGTQLFACSPASACAGGAWTCSMPLGTNTDLAGLTLRVDQSAPDGSAAPRTSTTGIIVDIKRPPNLANLTVTPTAVGLAGPNPPSMTASGGEAGSTVQLTVTGSTRGTLHPVTATATGTALVISGGGTFTCNPVGSPGTCSWDVIDTVTGAHTSTFPDGTYTASALEVDVHGNPAVAAATRTFTVKTTIPTPALNAIGNANGFIGAAATNPPTVGGSGAESGDTMTVTVKDAANATVGTCTAALTADGTWSCSNWSGIAGGAFANGPYTATARQVDAATNSSPTSSSVTFTVDLIQPGVPGLAIAPLVGTISKSATPTVTVTAAKADGTMTIVFRDAAGATVGACTDKAFTGTTVSCTPEAALVDGAFTVSATQQDLASNVSPTATLPFAVKTRTAKPALTSPNANATVSGSVTVSGTAEAGATLVVTVDGAARPELTVGSDGTWSTTIGGLSTGDHFAQATATDSVGNSAASDPRPFVIGLGGQVRGASTFGCSTSSSGAGWLLLAVLALLLPRRRSRLVAALAAVIAPAAMAQTVGLDHFRPSSGGDGFLGVEGARPPQDGDGALQLRFWMQGMNKPLVFLPDTGGEQALIRNRVGGWLGAQVHVTGPFSFAAQLPFLLNQSSDLRPLPPDVAGTTALGGGIGDLRLTGRMGLLRQGTSPIDLSAQLSADLPTAPKDKYLGDGALQGEALLAVGRRVDLSASALELGGNAFVRLRPSRELLGIKEGNEVGLRGAVAWLPESASPVVPARVLAEVEGASFLRAGFAGGSVPAEWRAGVTYCMGSALAFDFGAGGGLSSGIGAPALRVLGAISFGSPACGHAMSAAPVRRPQRLAEAAQPKPLPKPEAPVAKPPPEAVVAPPPSVAIADPDQPVLDAPKAAPAASGTRRKAKAKTVAAAPALPDLPMDLPPLEPQARPAAGKPAVAAAAPLPDLPLLDLPATTAPAPAAKKEKKVAMAPVLPDLPGLDLPPAAASVPAKGARLARLDGDKLALAKPISFQGQSARLGNEGRRVLDDVARLLSEHAELAIQVAGHSDAEATAGLAQSRAESVGAYLRSKGIPASRVAVDSFGASQPLFTGTRTSRKKNLRVELNVLRR